MLSGQMWKKCGILYFKGLDDSKKTCDICVYIAITEVGLFYQAATKFVSSQLRTRDQQELPQLRIQLMFLP